MAAACHIVLLEMTGPGTLLPCKKLRFLAAGRIEQMVSINLVGVPLLCSFWFWLIAFPKSTLLPPWLHCISYQKTCAHHYANY